MRYFFAILSVAMLLIAAPGHAGSEDFLSKDDRRAVQRALTQSGFDTRGVDGVFGKGTRRAIRDWQTFNGFRASGVLNPVQYAAITGDGASAVALSSSGEERAWRDARARDDEHAYRAYINRYPGGLHVGEARERYDRKRLVAGRRDRERALGLNRSQRREVEHLLAQSGFYPGSINGKFNKDTRGAIRDYRRSRGLDYHAFLDRKMLRRLVRDGDRNYSRQNGEDNTDVAVGVAAGALLLGGIILLSD